ncbi:MAG: Rpn family recombination-promoting nuclease/putative transposase [Gammaproteobacteria bacterium]
MSKNHIAKHDRFFRSAMSNSNVMQEFFAENLPDNIKKIIDPVSIKPLPDSFIDDDLKLQITDLLFSANFHREQGYIYLLVEHQSTPDPFIAFRIWKYVLAVMQRHLKEVDKKCLPIVYPMIFYTGWKPHNYSTDFFDLFGENKELAREIFTKPYRLIDLSRIPDTRLQETLRYGVLARTMKHIWEKDFLPTLKKLVVNLREIEKSGELSYIYSTLSYIVEAGSIHKPEDFREIIKNGLTDVDEEQIMTIAEQYRQKGIQQGREEGLCVVKTVASRLLKEGSSLTKVARLTGLSKNTLKEML